MKSKILLIIMILLICINIYPDELIDKYYTAAKGYYIIKDFENAFIQINFLLDYYLDKNLPEETNLLAENIYFDYLNRLMDNHKYSTLKEVTKSLSKYSRINSIKLLESKKKAEKIIVDYDKRKIKEKYNKELEEQNKKIIEETKTAEEWKNLSIQIGKFNNKVDMIIETNNKNSTRISRNSFLITLLVVISFLVFFIGFFFIVFFFIKYSNIKENRLLEYFSGFKGKVNVLSNPVFFNNLIPGNEIINQNNRLFIQDNRSKTKIINLLEKCNEIGKEIDEVSGRKNNAKNAAELIYKISIKLGFDNDISKLYYAAGLIYDIGLLNINKNIIKSDKINDDKLSQLKKHTVIGLGKLDFIDEEYKNIFIDAVSKHHENMDGSGYPEGLKGDKISYIARIIRIVESYLSITSKRNYNNIQDKESAVSELKKQNGKYDDQIVNILYEVI